jgi:hypothetical protein
LSWLKAIPILMSKQRRAAVLDIRSLIMSVTLPPAIAAYVAWSNAHDASAPVDCFAENAVVRDEGHDRRGIADIRAWKGEVTKKYSPVMEVLKSADAADGRTIVTGRVTGNFPGSPVELSYAFTLEGGKIARLEIAS